MVCAVCYGMTTTAQTYTLQQLKDSALNNNIAIRNARHSIDAAQQQRKEAFTKYFPNISGTGLWFNANKGMAQTTVTPSEVVPPSLGAALAQMLPAEALVELATPIPVSMLKNGTVAGVMATQPVFAGGQIINGNRLAKVGEDVSKLQLRLSENQVEKNIEQYYWQLVSLQEKMKTITAVEALLADNSELLVIRMQKAYNDVVEAQQQLQIAQRSIEQAEENLRLNRDYYRAGTSRMSDLLEAQLLYQQACDKQTDAFADYHNKLLEYKQATAQ